MKYQIENRSRNTNWKIGAVVYLVGKFDGLGYALFTDESGSVAIGAHRFEVKPEGLHAYEIEVNSAWDFITVEANNRTQAASIARKMGYEVRSVNLVG